MRRPIPTRTTRRAARRAGGLLRGVLAAAIAGLALPSAGCRKSPPPRQTKPVNVTCKTVQPLPELIDTLLLPGVVEPKRVVNVCAEVAAEVERRHCEEGDVRKKGQELISLNTDLLQAELDRASAQLEFDKKDFERVDDLRKRKLATAMEWDQTRSRWLSSKAAFDAAQARYDRAVIESPIDGVVNRLPKEEGEYVNVGDCVAEIVEIDTVKVVVHVPERDVPFLEKERSETILVGPDESRRMTGKITYISEVADTDALTTRVELEVPNRPGPNGKRPLHSGQIVRVRLTRQVLKGVILVPLSVVFTLEEGHAVYVVEGGRAVRRKVQLGLLKGGDVQVLDGLRPGDQLIVEGQQYVGPGQEVNVRTPATAASRPATESAPAEAAAEAPQEK